MEGFQKGDRIMRLRRIEQLLGVRQSVTVAGLAEELGVDRRTIQRDLVALETDGGVPLMCIARGRYTLVEGYLMKPVSFTVPEAVGMLLAARLMARFADRSLPFLAGAFEKLAASVPDEAVRHAIGAAAAGVLAGRPDSHFANVFATVARAWTERRKLELTYTSPREFSRVVWPLWLDGSLSGHAVHLVAWEEKREVVRAYRLDRVRNARALEARFDPPLGFDVEAMLENAWGIWTTDDAPVAVELIFSTAVARRVVETQWHRSQRLEQLGDGRVRMLVTVASTVEFKPWVLSWGREVEVVSPPEFRAELAAELQAAASAYGSGLPAELMSMGPPRARRLRIS